MSVTNLGAQIKEDHLTCSICCNRYTKPKALPCLHTFCESCLRDYVSSRGYESTGSFPCPICRTLHMLPSRGIEGFQDNHLMASLSDTVEKADSDRPHPVPKPRRSLGTVNQSDGNFSSNPPFSQSNVTQRFNQNNSYQSDRSMHRPFFVDEGKTGDFRNKRLEVAEGPDGFTLIQSENGNDGSSVDNSLPPPYSSVADTKMCFTDDDPGWMVVPNQNCERKPVSHSQSNIGWNLQNQDPPPTGDTHAMSRQQNEHSLLENNFPLYPYSQRPLYPTVPPNLAENVACRENLMLCFGKKGPSPKDFIKPVSIAVSTEGYFIVLDCGGEQHKIMIFNSGGNITAAFKCGTKVNDIVMTKQNEILASVAKGTYAMRLFTISGQLKGEYGKFFTYEQPSGVAEFNDKRVVLSGIEGQCIYILNQQMKHSTKFGRKGKGDGYFTHPTSVAVNSKDHVIVTDKVNHCVQVFSSDGNFKRRFGSFGQSHGHLQAPLGLCVDSLDNIIVADSDNFRVEAFSRTGQWLSSVVTNTQLLGENVRPVNVAVTPTGCIAVLLCGPYFAEVRIYTSRHQEIPQDPPVSIPSVFGFTLPNSLSG